MTRVIKADDQSGIASAAKALSDGGLVAFPTETVYGLGADARNSEAVKAIYKAKGRPSDNPLIVHISNNSQLNELVSKIPEKAACLMEAFWPGPLTLVFEKSDKIPQIITAGLDTVAIRLPQNDVALKLIEMSGVPVAAPSANVSGRPSPTCAGHVIEDLAGKIDYIIDGGPCTVGVESTVLDITTDPPVILRPGGITREMLESVIGPVEADTVLKVEGNSKPRSPGMKYRHYSPKAEMLLVSGEQNAVASTINRLARGSSEKGLRVGVLTTEEMSGSYRVPVIVTAGTLKSPETIAAGLYAALRKFDDEKVDIIYSETFEEQGLGQAIMNRLKKAASGKIIEAEKDF
ncbi:MAG: L-threonylcarbamoyladenylate synthase [Clostridia bacterium]|nr:L-threonylcarbamoyladenylate synthase [Clostridia bacterium]